MKIASSSFLFQNMPLSSALARIRDLGFKKAELAVDVDPRWGHFVPENIQNEIEESVRMVEAAESESGVEICDITTFFDFTNPSVRGQFIAVCDFAQRLSIPCVNVSATHPSEEICVNSLKDYVSIASNHSVTVSLEAFSPSICEDPAAALLMLGMVKGLKFTLDTGYLLAKGFGQDTWEPLFPHVGLVHARDAGSSMQRYQVPVGTGDLDAAKLVNSLKTAGFDGHIVVEYLGPGTPSRESMDYEEETLKMRELLESVLADRESA